MYSAPDVVREITVRDYEKGNRVLREMVTHTLEDNIKTDFNDKII